MIGRKEELKVLKGLESNQKPAFVAVYGRRRIGKTFLIRHVFGDRFSFYVTGIANVDQKVQLANFYSGLVRYFPRLEDNPIPTDWFRAFQYLISGLEQSEAQQKIIFMDELPWFDQANSGFISALEHFWNSWASARSDIILIVCGSAASWMISNLLNNRGGLHNRVTHRLPLAPFSLGECEEFLRSKFANYNRYQIIQLYMVLGGIPFYLELVDPGKSVAQNINDLCFSPRGPLRAEYENLYISLFKNPRRHIAVIEALSKKNKGLERVELLKAAKLADGGSASKTLRELEASGFIRKYPAFGKKDRYVLYQLSDFYSHFYIKFIRDSSDLDKDYWLNAIDSPDIRAWSGYAFEQVCLAHLDKIKHTLGISGIQTRSSAWVGKHEDEKAQVDLVIDRRDQVINLCEMKFSMDTYSIDKSYAEQLRRKIRIFKASTQTKKAIFLTLITTFGLEQGGHGGGLVQNVMEMDKLF